MNTADAVRFLDRAEGGRLLAGRLKVRTLRRPLVLGIPRGGVVTAAALAHELGAELDVVLARKLRAPHQPEFALGAVSEDGEVTLNPDAALAGAGYHHLEAERRHQLAEIARRRELYRAVRPQAPVAGRTVIVADDGLATGSTMIAALRATRTGRPHELIAAVPVASPDRLEQVWQLCDDVVCLSAPDDFLAVGQFYEWFPPIEDEEVVAILREALENTSRN